MNNNSSKEDRLLYLVAVHVIAINVACNYIGERDASATPQEYLNVFTRQAQYVAANMSEDKLNALIEQIHSEVLPSTISDKLKKNGATNE